MSLQELQAQVRQLSVSDRLTLVSTLIQSLQDTAEDEDWQYLVTRPHPWRRQLYIKGRKLLASTVWQDAIANEMSPEQAAENWDLPLAAIYEVIRYCSSHRELLKLEADEERYRLEEKGVRPDWFFSAFEQQRLSDLMNLWRTARAQGQPLPPEQQAELDSLVEAELKAATARTAALVQQLSLTENCKHPL